jgi:hypothetical protein
MSKVGMAIFAFAVLAALSDAQQVPAADVSVGYPFLFVAKGFTLKMNGGSGAVAFNVNPWLGVVGDFGVYDGSPGIPGLIGETYTFGPRFSYHRWNRLVPFAQAVIGGAHANSTNGGFLGANNTFAFGGGGGGDVGLDHAGRFALRGQMEFLDFRTRPGSTGTVHLSAGVVFRLGKYAAAGF